MIRGLAAMAKRLSISRKTLQRDIAWGRERNLAFPARRVTAGDAKSPWQATGEDLKIWREKLDALRLAVARAGGDPRGGPPRATARHRAPQIGAKAEKTA